MNDTVRRAALGLLLLAPTAVRAQFHEEPDLSGIGLSGQTPESIILNWPTFSYRLSRLMLAEYGQPAEASDHRLTWVDNAPWKRTVVYRKPPKDRMLTSGAGRLEQSVAYRVPPDRLADLGRFDMDIEADKDAGRLTAISDSESENILVLNLADEVIAGRRSPASAKEFRRKQLALRDSGKTSPYLERLLFVPAGGAPDPESPD
ncbi:MAG: hypothetical protein Q8T11_04925 [Elusimicrobiota bacterium]|nr:hypothetical protein [Elusimicrobiota bacterium]